VPDPVPSLPVFDPASLVGTTLDGRYLIEEHLATGGMGAVFRARHVYMRKDVALKVLRPDLSASAELVERFRRESEIAASLEHDHIVRVTDFGRSPEGWLFLAMELLFGESLFDRLRREGFLPPEEAVTILWQVCAGLEAAHARGVVHRDLKPENVFLARSPGGREVAKILDFGIAKMADPSEVGATQAGMVVGTPEYLSPEQATGSEVDGRADLYTVGIIAWRALTGRHPFKADDPRSLLMMQATRPVPPLTEPRPDLAELPALVAAVAKACEKDPNLRYQTAAALKDDLALSLGPSFALPPGSTPAPLVSYTSLAASDGTREPSGTIRLGSVPSSPSLPAIGPTASGRQPLAALPPEPRHGWLRDHKLLAAAALGGALALAVAALVTRSGPPAVAPEAVVEQAAEPPRPPPEPPDLVLAREHLSAGRARQARALLEALLVKRPDDPEQLRLLGHAFHDEGEELKAIDAWAQAQARAPLDDAALEHLASDLGRERAISDRAAPLLVKTGSAAGPVLAGQLAAASTLVRLRALAVAREIGPTAGVDTLGGYLALLSDPDCDVRRVAARGLGELKDRRALPRLREKAAERSERRGLFGVLIESKPACGAPEAAEAARRVEGR
jgi:eukaryotic-like serine/threonine-protein kinase